MQNQKAKKMKSTGQDKRRTQHSKLRHDEL